MGEIVKTQGRFILAPLSLRPSYRRGFRYAEWLYSVLSYLAEKPWMSPNDARECLAGYLHEADLTSTTAPLPHRFDLPDPGTDWNGRSSTSKCRQQWWRRKRDHGNWIKHQVRWLEHLLRCLGFYMDYDNWQIIVRQMLTTYSKTSCGCDTKPEVKRPLRSPLDLGLYDA